MTKELKRFEKWWDAEDDIPNDGPYTPDTPIQFAWAGWQAALAQPELTTQPAPVQQETVLDNEFMKKVLSVAIAGLFEHYKDDVLRVFSLDDLHTVVDLSESLRLKQVEDIYRRAWDILAAAPQPAQPEQEPVQFEAWLAKQHGDPEEIGFLQALRIAYIAGQDSITTPPQRKPLTDV